MNAATQDQNRLGFRVGGMTAPAISTKREIPAKVEQIQHMFNDLENSARRLIESARSVARIPPPPGPSDVGMTGVAQETELGSALEMIRIRMANLDAEINAAIDRIEL